MFGMHISSASLSGWHREILSSTWDRGAEGLAQSESLSGAQVIALGLSVSSPPSQALVSGRR
jgi:hypothetical protein